MAEGGSMPEPNVMAQQETSRYSARVIITVNRTARKKDDCYDKYDKLPQSAVTTARKLERFFKSLNMSVKYKENVDKRAIRELVSEVIEQSHSYGDNEKIIFYYIGHGEKDELLPHCKCKVCALPGIEYDRESDGKPQNIVELVKLFHTDDTKHLRKIPILFFFDCCQGPRRNEGVEPASLGGRLPADVQAREMISYVNRIPDAGNILITQSTLPMLMAYCHPQNGPYWSEALLRNLQIDQSISDALHATQREVSIIDCDIRDHDGNLIVKRRQPPMFYSTLYCETINFYSMGASLRRANSGAAKSTMKEPDSGYPEETYSTRIDGDDTGVGSEPSKTAAAFQRELSSLQGYESDQGKSPKYLGSNTLLQKLKALQEDIEVKTEKISQLEQKITKLKQEAKEKDQKYEVELAKKEKERNDLETTYEAQLKQKEEELVRIMREAQQSKVDNQRKMKELKEEHEKTKRQYEDTIKKIKDSNEHEMLKLTFKHLQETKKLEIKIKDQEKELEMEKRQVAEEKEQVAKLKEVISKKELDEARKERDEAIKRANEAEKKVKDLETNKDEKKVEIVQDQSLMSSTCLTPTASADSKVVPITQGMKSMNLNYDTEGAHVPDDNNAEPKNSSQDIAK